MGQSFINLVAGFLIGHLYLYIKGPLLDKYKIDFLKTPSILHSLARLYNNRFNEVVPEAADEDNDDLYE
jgi:hypothetical protein